jgi:predicted hotdog family 3-hydroxylacyl-ACP dehydratase
MCLLDGVARWNDASIECFAGSHRQPDNPLRQNGRLGAACAIEYGAQAMAIHGALAGIGQRDARPGYLVSVRALELHVARLDDIAEDLEVSAERLVAEQERVLYQFTVAAAGHTLCSGRATVVLAGGER